MNLLLLTSCVLDVAPMTFDYSDESVPKAIDLTIDALAETYAFTDHKQLDWEARRAELAELGSGDADTAIRHLILTLPDAHGLLFNDDPQRDLCPEAAGTLGFELAEVDDGTFIVAASEHDEVVGATVLNIDGDPIEVAIDAAPLHCFPVGMGTYARIRQVAGRLLARAPVGSQRELSLELRGESMTRSFESIEDPRPQRTILGIQAPEKLVDHRMVEDDIGYLAISWEETAITEVRVESALVSLYNDGARNLVLDLRNNEGGTDGAAANIIGFFTQRQDWLYETITMYDHRKDEQSVVSEVWVNPQDVVWNLPTIALINAETVSSGEGIAMMLQQINNVTIMGFEGTAAAFGSTGFNVKLPGGWTLTYPAGRSLDIDGNIQLDSDHTMQGGVLPDVVVPWTPENRVAATKGEDPVLAAAIAALSEGE